MAVTLTKKPGKAYDDHLGDDPPQKINVKPAIGTVHGEKSIKGANPKIILDKEEVVHPGIMAPASELCSVYVSGGQTVNLGNYESAKITVGITIPCLKADLNETYDFATEWVSKKVEEAVSGVKN